jgi:HK97 family phage portal protein
MRTRWPKSSPTTAGAWWRLEPIAWHRVSVQVLPSGRIAYDIAPHDVWRGGSERAMRRLLSDEVLHLRDRVSGGEVMAKSQLQRAAGAISNVGALQEMSLAVWKQGMRPSGIISAPTSLTPPQRSLAANLLEKFKGVRGSGGVILMEAGWTFHPQVIDAESVQTLESRRFGTEEIARAFQISPIFLQDWSRSTFTTAKPPAGGSHSTRSRRGAGAWKLRFSARCSGHTPMSPLNST